MATGALPERGDVARLREPATSASGAWSSPPSAGTVAASTTAASTDGDPWLTVRSAMVWVGALAIGTSSIGAG